MRKARDARAKVEDDTEDREIGWSGSKARKKA